MYSFSAWLPLILMTLQTVPLHWRPLLRFSAQVWWHWGLRIYCWYIVSHGAEICNIFSIIKGGDQRVCVDADVTSPHWISTIMSPHQQWDRAVVCTIFVSHLENHIGSYPLLPRTFAVARDTNQCMNVEYFATGRPNTLWSELVPLAPQSQFIQKMQYL